MNTSGKGMVQTNLTRGKGKSYMDPTTKSQIKLSDQSIVNELKSYNKKPEEAICEFIWNSFDAEADNVSLVYKFPQAVGGSQFGYPTFSIADDGVGWDLQKDIETVEIFLDSKKRPFKKPYRSIPHGSKGVGRFTFHSFASKATWRTNVGGRRFELTLERQELNKYELTTTNKHQLGSYIGTTVSFVVDSALLNEAFFEQSLRQRLLEKFGWFLVLYPKKRILLNNVPIDAQNLIRASSEHEIDVQGNQVNLLLVQWKGTLADKENSKLYCINSKGHEVYKGPTGLNYQADHFYHSAFARSNAFDRIVPDVINDLTNEEEEKQTELFSDTDQQDFMKKLKHDSRVLLEQLRRPYIAERSDQLIDEWLSKPDYPKPEEYGADPTQYRDIVKQTLIIAPTLYVGVSDEHRKVTLSLMASLLGSNESNLILTILNQVYELSSEERETLRDILGRTTLKNILSTIKEIDGRLQLIEDLDSIIYDSKYFRETKEVIHLQQILNTETWIFGEEFRLVIDTEGTIKTAIKKWAKDILGIDLEPDTTSRKELDMLLAKKIESQDRVVNLVVELKRPSVTLGKKELDQIKTYRDKLMEEPACNGSNIEWRFVLVGRDYDQIIEREIEGYRNFGETHKGLVSDVPSENTKIYVRKWTDILNVEQRSKHRFLKDKLQIQLKEREGESVQDIVDHTTHSVETLR